MIIGPPYNSMGAATDLKGFFFGSRHYDSLVSTWVPSASWTSYKWVRVGPVADPTFLEPRRNLQAQKCAKRLDLNMKRRTIALGRWNWLWYKEAASKKQTAVFFRSHAMPLIEVRDDYVKEPPPLSFPYIWDLPRPINRNRRERVNKPQVPFHVIWIMLDRAFMYDSTNERKTA